MTEKIAAYRNFWPYYLRQHAKPATRALHYVGTALAILSLVAFVGGDGWALLGAVVYGYLFAWIGHFFIEKNRPATFTHPWWSLISDVRMFGLWVVGGLAAHLEDAGVAGK
jgi:hypothetical protein